MDYIGGIAGALISRWCFPESSGERQAAGQENLRCSE